MPMSCDPIATRGRHLNHVAWLYDPLVEKLSFGREERFREKTLAWMALRPGQRVLDVGCGTGSLTLRIAEHLAGTGEVWGIDAAPRMIAIARRKAAKRGVAAQFAAQVAERLRFADATFDVAVNSMFTHHVDRELKLAAFCEMRRVLRSGGLLVTADLHRPRRRWAWLLGWTSRWLLRQPELEDNLQGRLPAIMAKAGFTDIVEREQVYGLVSFFTARKR